MKFLKPTAGLLFTLPLCARGATVTAPVYVRYAWAGWPKGANLSNAANIPASPFTSQEPAVH